MQDGKDIPAEEAGEWLKERFDGAPEPEITFVMREGLQPDPAGRRRLLEILFGPRADSDAA